MKECEVQSAIENIIAKTLNISIEGDQQVSRESVKEWDSLKHIEVVFAVEEVFDVEFPEDEIGEIQSLDDLVNAVMAHHAA